jgi:hypothetical protein
MPSWSAFRTPKLRTQIGLVRSVASATVLVSSINLVSALKYWNCVTYGSLLLRIYSSSYNTEEDPNEFSISGLINI